MFPIKQIYFSQIFSKLNVNMVLCEICYHLYNLKKEKKHGVVLLLVKVPVSACKYTKSNSPP